MTCVLDQIAAQRVVPVIRSASVDDAVATARACARGGLSVVELTRSVPDVEQALLELRDDELTLGLGTVTEAVHVDAAVAAGARFVVSFARPGGFVARARQLGVLAIPGAFTPSEVSTCAAEGAAAVKLFPARLCTPAYLRDLRAVLPNTPVMVTGGIPAACGAISEWLDAGAIAIGLGSDLGTVAQLGADEVEARATAVFALTRANDNIARSRR